jgi:hypothetical protein
LQGWLDVTYLSPEGDFRLSRGNKGTLFILVKDVPVKERLLAAVNSRADDAEVRPSCDVLHRHVCLFMWDERLMSPFYTLKTAYITSHVLLG